MSDEKIDAIHPDLQKRLTAMRRSRDFLEGADALRAHDLASGAGKAPVVDSRDRKFLGQGEPQRAGGWGNPLTAYLPRLSETQSEFDYQTYVYGAMYPNLLEATRRDYRGLIFSKPPAIELPAAIEYMRQNCDMRGTPILEALETVTDELYAVSRFGWWADMPVVPKGTNRAKADAAGYRPYLVPFKSEEIINWDFDEAGAKIMQTRVVLKDCDEDEITELLLLPRVDDATGIESYVYTVRRYELAEQGVVGKVIAGLTGDVAKKQWVRKGPDEIPLMGGKPINEIPFYFFSPFGGEAKPRKPMLYDNVMVAWSLYQSSALLEHSRFTCGLATANAFGFPDDAVFDLGGLNVIKNSNPDAKFFWAERKGEDCLPLERAVAQKTEYLIQLGSKGLEEAKKAAESAAALRIRASGDTASCADVALGLGRIASQALSFCARWMGANQPATVTLTTDYSNNVADAAEITALDKSVTSGNLPQKVYWDRLRKTGVIDPSVTDEDIAALLEADTAAKDARAADAQGAALAATAAMLAKGKQGGNAA